MKKQKNAPQILPHEEWPYEVPENWVWTRLLSGGAECLDKYRQPVNAAERKNREGNIPYYGATGQVGWIDTYLTDEQLVLLGEDGAPFLDAEKNKAYIIEGPAWVNNHAHILRSLYGNIGNLFLLHYLNQFDYVNYVSGTTRLKLTQAKMNEMPFPLPPLPEQQRIVARIESLFSKLDAAAEKIRATIDTFPTRKTALLHKAFTGELTKKWRKEHGVGTDSWKDTHIEKIATVKGGKRIPKGMQLVHENTGHPYLKAGNLKNGTVIDDNIMFVNDETLNHIRQYTVKAGDIYITNVGACIGDCGIIPSKYDGANLTENAVKLTDLQCNSEFLAKYIASDSIQNVIKNKIASATLGKLSILNIKSIKIKLPSSPEQQEIVRRLDAILSREQTAKETAERLLDTIALTKKSILARAFRGLLGTNNPKEKSAEGLLKNSKEDY